MSPPVLSVPSLMLGVWACQTPGTYRHALLYFLVAIAAPVLYVVWLLKSGRIDDFHLPERRDRVKPFLASTICGLVAIGLLVALKTPAEFLAPILAVQLEILVLFVVTLFWQVSIHTAVTAGLVTFSIRTLGPASIALFLLVPLVSWARVYLGRHTVAQALAGACIGSTCFTLLFATRGLWW